MCAPPWRLFQPAGAVQLTGRRARHIRRLPSGTPVVVTDDRVLSRWRQRRWRRVVSVERELLVLPTLDRPIAVVDQTPEAVEAFWSLATVPPGVTRGVLAASLVLTVIRRLPWTWTAALAPGRVVMGVRR